MDHKQKAQELVAKFQGFFPLMLHKEKINPKAIECATILVNEVIEVLENLSVMESGSEFMDFGQNDYRKVLEEIQKLPESEIAPGKDIDQKDNACSKNDDTL